MKARITFSKVIDLTQMYTKEEFEELTDEDIINDVVSELEEFFTDVEYSVEPILTLSIKETDHGEEDQVESGDGDSGIRNDDSNVSGVREN